MSHHNHQDATTPAGDGERPLARRLRRRHSSPGTISRAAIRETAWRSGRLLHGRYPLLADLTRRWAVGEVGSWGAGLRRLQLRRWPAAAAGAPGATAAEGAGRGAEPLVPRSATAVASKEAAGVPPTGTSSKIDVDVSRAEWGGALLRRHLGGPARRLFQRSATEAFLARTATVRGTVEAGSRREALRPAVPAGRMGTAAWVQRAEVRPARASASVDRPARGPREVSPGSDSRLPAEAAPRVSRKEAAPERRAPVVGEPKAIVGPDGAGGASGDATANDGGAPSGSREVSPVVVRELEPALRRRSVGPPPAAATPADPAATGHVLRRLPVAPAAQATPSSWREEASPAGQVSLSGEPWAGRSPEATGGSSGDGGAITVDRGTAPVRARGLEAVPRRHSGDSPPSPRKVAEAPAADAVAAAVSADAGPSFPVARRVAAVQRVPLAGPARRLAAMASAAGRILRWPSLGPEIQESSDPARAGASKLLSSRRREVPSVGPVAVLRRASEPARSRALALPLRRPARSVTRPGEPAGSAWIQARSDSSGVGSPEPSSAGRADAPEAVEPAAPFPAAGPGTFDAEALAERVLEKLTARLAVEREQRGW